MTDSYMQGSMQSFTDKLASESPEPGGGSVAAMVGALGAALISMVANLTVGREKYAAVEKDVEALLEDSERLRGRLEELVTLDTEAYAKVALAMKLPRGTESEKAERDSVLQSALRGAAEVPLSVAEASAEVAALSKTAAEVGNANAVSDAGVAAVLADAAAQSAALNVRINLAWINDEEFNARVWAKVEGILSQTAMARDVVLAMTYEKI